MKFSPAVVVAASTVVGTASALSFDTSSADDDNFVTDFKFVNRVYVPYGPDLTTTPIQSSDDVVWTGYGYGVGAAEHVALDGKDGILYVQGEAGPYITILDYYEFPPKVTAFGLDLGEYNSDLKDVAVCPEKKLLFVSAVDADKVLMFRAISRDDPKKPELLAEIDAGKLPDVLLPNEDCSILAVTNENEGEALNEGAVHLVSNLEENGRPTVRKVTFDGFTDEYLLSRDVHMPLTKNAMEYWDLYSKNADDIDWTSVREQYNPGLFLEPEFMAFNADGDQLYVNLQENSALLRIDVESGLAKAVDGYGLKSWTFDSGNEGIDLVKDDGCSAFVKNAALHSVRAPDGMALVTIDGESYVLTADEGDDKDYGNYEEKREAGELFAGNAITERGFTADVAFFNPADSADGATKHFNGDCEDNNGTEWCADGAEISIGSSAVDYSDPRNPVMSKIVLFGGRGLSIFKVPKNFDDRIAFVWDSGSQFEKEGCRAFPWAHNGIQDESFSSVGGAYYILNEDDRQDLDEMNDPNFDGCENAGNGMPGACPMSETIDDKSPEDGPAPESVVVGVACSRLVAISCGENNSNCFLYDITDINNPNLIKTFNLSPASETKSPGVAYEERVLGEHDPETIKFLVAEDSPTGKAGVLFAGAISGTVSFYEFECANPLPAVDRPFTGISLAVESEPEDDGIENDGGGLSGGAIAGIVIASVAFLGLLAYTVKSKKQDTIIIDGSKTTDPDQVA